jgi:uncharacterized protein (TIGR02118 family)
MPGLVAVFAAAPPPSDRAPGRWYSPAAGATSGRDGAVATIAVLGSDAAPAPGALEVYRVEPRLQWDESRGDDVEVTQLSFVHRAATLDRDAFARHWSEVHAPLARVHHPTVVRYAQHVVLDVLTPGAPEVDGIAELTFRSLDACRNERYDSPEGKQIVQADVARFLAPGAGWRAVARLQP